MAGQSVSVDCRIIGWSVCVCRCVELLAGQSVSVDVFEYWLVSLCL